MTTSAPGKLMLFGEHAVVYGYPCIVTAVSERLYVSEGAPTGDTRFLDAAIEQWGKKDIRLMAKSSFSGKYGFGSSSAVTVAALKMLRPQATNEEVFKKAFEIVQKVQKVGSGFDVAAATYGGMLYYVKNKTIEPLTVSSMPLIVAYTGVKSNTVDMVNAVSHKREQYKEKVERIFQAITKIVNEAKVKLQEGDWERVGRLMDFNHEYLRDLGVSSEKLETLISVAKQAGAYGAKLSGAGGGDCMIAVGPPEVAKALEKAGGTVVHVTPGETGVRIETTDNQDEMFIVVDKDDKVLGYKTRHECHHNKSLIHRTIGSMIFNDKGQLLLQKRSATKDMDPNLWQISSAGHVVKGQTTLEAVHRELQEELGVDAPLTQMQKFLVTSENETELTTIFKGTHNGPFTTDKEEVAEVKFFDPREIRLRVADHSLMFTKAATMCLTKVGIL